jgi:prefoldin subunit 5
MKPSRSELVFLPSFLLAVVSAAGAAEFTPESRVAEVTVYRQGALVTRESRLSPPPGSHRVVLQGLPCVADPDSVRVSGSGSAGLEIGGIEVQQEFRLPSLTPGYRQIESEMEELRRQQALLDDRQRSIATLREFLGGLKASGGQESSRGVLAKGFAVESWQKAFEFFSARLNDLSREERSIESERRGLAEDIAVASGKLTQMASQGGIKRWNAAVLVHAPRGGEMTLRVSYLATGAAWQPLYDARLDPATGKVSLSWQAQVSQTTGEDWNDVAVTLATTRPSAGIDLPILASLQLRALVAQNGRSQGGLVNIIDGASVPILGRNYQEILTLAPGVSDGDGNPTIHGSRDTDVVGQIDIKSVGATAEYSQAAEHALASAARREAVVTFVLPGRLDIPSDGQPHKHLIATREMDAQVEHHAVPAVVPAVYLVAKVTLPEEVPLLQGKVQHFVGADLVGSSWMAERAPGEEFSLSFGPDDRLKADRKQVSKKAGRRGKEDEIVHCFVTTLENHLGRDGLIEVKDRIPVSPDERIEVALDEDETTPGATTDEKEPGILTWKVPVPKGGKKEIALTYRVRSPRGVVLAGLE